MQYCRNEAPKDNTGFSVIASSPLFGWRLTTLSKTSEKLQVYGRDSGSGCMVAFYEKVIKVKADVAAVLVSATH
jgi:hypothetical protein